MQSERVSSPPVTNSVSVGLRARAPWRINTLFWSFIFFPFHYLDPLNRSDICEMKKRGTEAAAFLNQHSPKKVSPSLPFGPKVQTVSVCRLPFTLSTSCSFSSRAPLRFSTLLSFMLFSFRCVGAACGTQTLQKVAVGRPCIRHEAVLSDS